MVLPVFAFQWANLAIGTAIATFCRKTSYCDKADHGREYVTQGHSGPIIHTAALVACDCYLLPGDEPGYFQHYLNYDFRNRVPSSINVTTMPPRVNNSQNDGKEPLEPSIISDKDFFENFKILTGNKDPDSTDEGTIIYSAQNVFYYQSQTQNETLGPNPVLVLRSTRNKDFHHPADLTLSTARTSLLALREYQACGGLKRTVKQ
jgi:hypothetical protein